MSGDFPNRFVSNGLSSSAGNMGGVHSFQSSQDGIFQFDNMWSQLCQQAAFINGIGCRDPAAIYSLPTQYEASLFKLIELHALQSGATPSALFSRHMNHEGGEFPNIPLHHLSMLSGGQSNPFNPYIQFTFVPNLLHYGYCGLNMLLLDEERRILIQLLLMAARNLILASEANNHLNGQLVAHIIANSLGIYSEFNYPIPMHIFEQNTQIEDTPPTMSTQTSDFRYTAQACCDTSPPLYIQRKEQVEQQEQQQFNLLLPNSESIEEEPYNDRNFDKNNNFVMPSSKSVHSEKCSSDTTKLQTSSNNGVNEDERKGEGVERQSYNEWCYEKIRNTKIKGYNRLVYFDGKDYVFDNDEAPPPGEKRTYILLADNALNAEKHIKPAVRRTNKVVKDTPAALTISNVAANTETQFAPMHTPNVSDPSDFSYFESGYQSGNDSYYSRNNFCPQFIGYNAEQCVGSSNPYFSQFQDGSGDGSCRNFPTSNYNEMAVNQGDVGAFYAATELERKAQEIAKADISLDIECAQEWPPLPRPTKENFNVSQSSEENQESPESTRADKIRIKNTKNCINKKTGRKCWRSISSEM